MLPRLPPPTIASTISRLRVVRALPRLPTPEYRPETPSPTATSAAFLSVESFRRHMTDEGWQIQAGLQEAGYSLFGHGLPNGETSNGETDVRAIVDQIRPATVAIQDPREWDATAENCFDKQAQFHNAETLAEHPEIFKVAILKDAHRDGGYYRQKAAAFGVHAWIVYYHPAIVAHLAPWVRPEHLIRTYHTIDPYAVPAFVGAITRGDAIISEATALRIYPLRTRLTRLAEREGFNGGGIGVSVEIAKHPGYHARGSQTPEYLKKLSRFKVSICTASIYGYALRKIIESTAAGCVVVTDLPADDVLPEIDGNLVRVSPSEPLKNIAEIVREAVAGYDAERQWEFVKAAVRRYAWQVEGRRLAGEIERMRVHFGSKQRGVPQQDAPQRSIPQ